MLKYIALMTMGVFGAASMAVAGAPITTITTTIPRPHRLERPVVHAKKPNLIPKVPRVGTNMRVRDQQSGTQPRIRGLPGHRGMVSTGHRLMVPQRIVPVVKGARLPDLVIRSAVIRPAKVCRSGAPVLYVTARVVNIGRGASTAKPSVGMVQARNTGGVNWGNGHGLPALAPGASASVRFPIYYLQSNPGYMRGTHTFKLTVNAGKWLHESNYANNGFRPVRVTLPPGLCGAKAGSVTHGNMPDLIPQVSNPLDGIIKVKNIGNAAAGASKLTVSCKNLGGGPGSDCPSTPALDHIPSNASGALLESVPALNAGQVYTITLPMTGLKWGKGQYLITYKADATHLVAESSQ